MDHVEVSAKLPIWNVLCDYRVVQLRRVPNNDGRCVVEEPFGLAVTDDRYVK